ncbi:MAG: hypothetical protein ACE5OS_04700 [Anaerolineae bacterium]
MIIYNDRGTAAGFYLLAEGRSPNPPLRVGLEGGKHLFVTPGTPYEMEGMVEQVSDLGVAPLLLG